MLPQVGAKANTTVSLAAGSVSRPAEWQDGEQDRSLNFAKFSYDGDDDDRNTVGPDSADRPDRNDGVKGADRLLNKIAILLKYR